MTNTLADKIRADRKTGTPGPWATQERNCGEVDIGLGDWSAHDEHFALGVVATAWDGLSATPANARRIARLPDLEDAYLALVKRIEAADKLAESVCSVFAMQEEIVWGEDHKYAAIVRRIDDTLSLALAAYREAGEGE